MNGTTIGDDRARASALGIALHISEAADRVTDPLPAAWPEYVGELRPLISESIDSRGPYACPTCADGIRTIESPARCRECVKAGL